MDDGTTPCRLADDFQIGFGISVTVDLSIGAPIAMNGELETLGQCVDDGDPHAVETSGDLVRVVVELAAGVEHRHDDFGSRSSLFFVIVDRYPTTVVGDRHGLVRVNDHRHFGAVACKRLVNGIVDGLEHHMMKACAIIGVADIHSGPLAHGLEALQDLDI